MTEELAKLVRTMWAQWMHHFMNRLSNENWIEWTRLINTPYKDLSDGEKESFRVWARKIVSVIKDKK